MIRSSFESPGRAEYEAAPETPPLTEKEEKAFQAAEGFKDRMAKELEKEPETTSEAMGRILKAVFSRESFRMGWYGNLATEVMGKTQGTKRELLSRTEGEARRVNERYDELLAGIERAKQERAEAEDELEEALNEFEAFKQENGL